MLRFFAEDPSGLLEKFKRKIAARQGLRSIDTWEQVGENFGHTAERWKGKMVFKAQIGAVQDRRFLLFKVASMSKGTQEEQQMIYAYYHGHMLQTFIDHLGDEFTSAVYKDGRG
ncbi:hypothetical protein [Xanthomonas sacchari]|uniref:hypothetical protein n=1 Tax=Xanthomonas sacchari TaxID=56458 RepID=UPI0022521F75|nr:hypothetical protein [Xanthomonas sacchari]